MRRDGSGDDEGGSIGLTVARFVKGMEALQTGWLHLGCIEIWGCHRVLAEVRERILELSV